VEKLQGISPAIRTVLDRSLCKNPDDRYQTAEDLAKALRAAKDPSWMGQVEEATTLLQASASAPTAAARPATSVAAAATTFQGSPLPSPAPAPTPAPGPQATPRPRSRGGKGLWVGLAALVLAGIGGASWWFLRGGAPAQAAASPTVPETSPSIESSKPQPRPASGTTTGTPGKDTSAGTTGEPKHEAQAETRPVPSKPAEPGPGARPGGPKPETRPEAKSIDQPELYQPEKLEKLQVHERLNLGNVSLSEAIQLADSKPDQAIQGFRQAIKADPYNVNAHAWLAVVLHDQGRTPEFVQEIREARRQGLLGQMASRNARFRSVLSQARFNRKLPADLMD
jgi:tetratricopeptide (TPR) repeat protein